MFCGEFPYLWMKEIRGKRPIDLYDKFLPSIVEILNGLQQFLFEKIEQIMAEKHPQ